MSILKHTEKRPGCDQKKDQKLLFHSETFTTKSYIDYTNALFEGERLHYNMHVDLCKILC